MNIFTIKIIALILMLMDHIGEFFPDSPIWFRWLGRLAAPLFFYALAVGFQHTRNRKKYLLRLYLANVGMVFFNQIMCMLQRKLDYVAYQPKNHNIFTTLFCAGVLICIWENRKEKKEFFTYIGIYIFWQAMVMGLAILAEAFDYVWRGNALLQTVLRTNYIFPLLGGIWDAEGGVFFIVLGIWLYCAVENKWKLALRYILFCGAYMFMCQGDILYRIMSRFSFWGYHKLADVIYFGSSFVGIPLGTSDLSLLTEFYQWMMIGALPIMLSCNGKRGKSLKWLFYAAYPLQFLVLYGISYYK